MKISCIGKNENITELLPQVVERIFKVCKHDSSFKLKDNLNIIDDVITNITKKIEKQKILLEKSSNLKKDLIRRLKIIHRENEMKQNKLLDMIGDE